jgi:hypothetical protein
MKTKRVLKATLCGKGYHQMDFTINGERFRPQLHRYVYEQYHGYKLVAGEQIDHINRNKLDNSIRNLQKVTSMQNSQNKVKRLDSKQKYKGIERTSSGAFAARLRANNTKEYIGCYPTPEEAMEARIDRIKWLNANRGTNFNE